jgi:endogenous inhibitor of DNA gyrase (YacG/DUF329 family)
MAEECRYCHRRIDVKDPVHAQYFPFCSDRCKMAELGLWFQDKYVLSRDIDEVADEAAPGPDAKSPPPEKPPE